MKLTLIAFVLFLFSIVLLGTVTLFESALVGVSPAVERLLTSLLLVLPTGTGAVLCAISLIRREGRAWIAAGLLALNAFFALFHLMIILFAG